MHVAEYAKKWEAFYRVLRKNVGMNAVNCAAENGFEAVTCGHTHFAEDMVLNGVRYINTGAWTEFPTHYLLVTKDEMILNRVDDYFVVQRVQSPVSMDVDPSIHFEEDFQNSTEAEQDVREILS